MKRKLVGFSKFMGVSSMLSLGLVLGIAVWAMAAMPPMVAMLDADAGWAMLVSMAVFIPVILCLVARGSEARDGSTPYAVVRRNGSPRFLFATGWLSLAGYLAIASLMVESIGIRAAKQLELFADIQVPLLVVVAPVTVIAGLCEVLAPAQHPKVRDTARWVLVSAVTGVLLWIVISPPPSSPGAEVPSIETTRWLSAVAIPAAGLWVMELLLDHRSQFRRSDRTMSVAMVITWVVSALLTAWACFLVAKHPDLMYRAEGVVEIVWARDRFRLLASVFTYAISIIALVKCLSRATRVAESMAADGLLPETFRESETRSLLPGPVLVFLSVIVSLLGAFWSNVQLLGVASVSALWVALITIALGLQRKDAIRPGALKLPLHPFFPLVAVGACSFFSLIIPQPSAAVTAGWLLVGFLVIPRFGRRAVITADSVTEKDDDSEESAVPERHENRVLVCLGPARNEQTLILTGAAIARARGGDLVVLRIISLLEQLPRARIRRQAEEAWNQLEARLVAEVEEGLESHPVVRAAPTIESGLLEAARQFAPDLVLLDLPATAGPGDHDHLRFLETSLSTVAQPVAVICGTLREVPQRVLVAASEGSDTPLALDIGRSLATLGDNSITVAHVHAPLEDVALVQARLDSILGEPDPRTVPVLVESEDTGGGLDELRPEHDLLIMGCTRDRTSSATLAPESLMTCQAASRKGPLLLVRSRETVTVRWFSRFWRQAYTRLPTLTSGERAEVYSEMRHSAAANVDFFVLIVIASAIATFGLVQNSAAVIIGAMLVAPLMSPIVAISQGIVQGNLRMVRRSLASTTKGAAVSIAVATGFVLAFPKLAPTAEIMARTQPTLFDLGVGLAAGAAAAYSVSRKAVAAALPGTAISVALVPPLCVVGFGLASDRLDIGIGALLLFLTNLAAIVFVCVVVFLLLGFFPRDKDRHSKARGALAMNLVALGLLSVPLGISSCHTTRIDSLETAVESVFRTQAEARGMTLRNVMVDEANGVFVVTAALYADSGVSPEDIRQLRDGVEKVAGIPVRLEAFVVHADRIIAAPEDR